MQFETLADWLAWQENLHPLTIDLGLARVSGVLKRLNLVRSQPYVISVGGTNGKGSCVAMLDSILSEAGYRVGTYTSPHILEYSERIRVCGQKASNERIMRSFDIIEQVRAGTSLSFFEFSTLAALEIFSESDLDVWILEVGLGGRLDAVNIVDPDAALLASIDIDHMEWLGDTREAIGFEKAGIFRTGKPAIVGDPDLPESVTKAAVECGSTLYRQGLEFGFQRQETSWSWWAAEKQLSGLPLPAIPGDHQLLNASAVLQCIALAHKRLPVRDDDIRRGLRNVELPGRFQLFPGDIPVLLDVAHNPQAVRILADHLQQQYAGKRIIAVFSVMRDKDIAQMVACMRDLVDSWYLAPLNMTRAATPEYLAGILENAGVGRIRQGFASAGEACTAAKNDAKIGDLVLVFGSFFLVSEYLAFVA